MASRSNNNNANQGKSPRKTRRHFTQEFKLEAVRLAEGGGRSLNELAHELGIRPNVLRQWRRQAEARAGRPADDIFPGHGRLPSRDEEIRQLKREVARLTEERDILKKGSSRNSGDARVTTSNARHMLSAPEVRDGVRRDHGVARGLGGVRADGSAAGAAEWE